jgi:cardiolipin synthase
LDWWDTLDIYWHEITAWGALIHFALVVFTVGVILTIKKDTTSAIAWCLFVFFFPFPFVGAGVFYLLGYQHVHRPLSRRVRQRQRFRVTHPSGPAAAVPGGPVETTDLGDWDRLAALARRLDAFPLTIGNQVEFYFEGPPAYDAMLAAIHSAQHHIHLEFFIVQPDEAGRLFVAALAEKARAGVEVRLIYDAMGSHRLDRATLQPLRDAGGQAFAFMPVSLMQRRMQVNLRNHRKILVVDGKVAFTGGLNIGDEYVGKVAYFGFWRDTHLRLEGPAVAGLQRVFIEDWDFSAGQHLKADAYFPPTAGDAEHGTPVQVIYSGPDQAINSIREVYFAAILAAREKLWIATPYFVPDAGVYDALCLAGRRGVDVRLLCQFHPDKWIPYFAGRYYFSDVLAAGVKVYQYTRGMMHSKVMLVDGQWASVGSANLDNRSMHLNFEVNCLFYAAGKVAELETAFRRDLEGSIQLQPEVFAERPFTGRLIENACRLLSPVL